MEWLNFHNHQRQSPNSVRSYHISEDIPDLPYFSAGIHPWYIDQRTLEDDLKKLEVVVQRANCIAIGECGLDRLKGPDIKLQQDVLIRQLELARKYKKPVVLHLVKAYDELYRIVSSYPKVKMVVHGFTGSIRWMRKLSEAGCYFSMGKAVLVLPHLKEVVKEIPFEKLLLETDDEDEVLLRELYTLVAGIRGMDQNLILKQIHENFRDLLRIKISP